VQEVSEKKNPFVFKDDDDRNKVTKIPPFTFILSFSSQKKNAKFSHFSLFPLCRVNESEREKKI
jgi:hypothetical protein